ncbi:hypothetical protein [Aurantibacillus circumpalustris]|uniref:hypothetical protein n=1 Tax=Aurantibacillus circumpalustris TaxID=3036359 RepID=UPI00295C260F|nr:hypothetical protein [Aurantibacillus circumpalustris]
MDIRERLEAEHSKSLTLAIVKFIGDDKKRFKELMTIFLNGEYRLTQRSAWPLSYIVIDHPELLQPYFDVFLQKLNDESQHPAIARNIFRVLQEIKIPEKYEGILIDKAFKIIMSEMQPAAVRAFAITVAAKISKQYPELKNEFLIILKELGSLPQLPSMRSRIKMALKELKTV